MLKREVKFNNFKKDALLHKGKFLNSFGKVLISGWYILGKEVQTFEGEFSRYLGVKYCIGVANGLEAIQISLMACGIGPGDEVITTPLSAVATTLAILAVRAKPVFVDTDKNGQIDEKQIEAAITKKTKAVLPVHLYGQPCQIDKIKRICRARKILLIEDAAQAHGASFKGKKLGSIGDVGCFSFYPTKNLGAIGDGGCIVTNNSKIAALCKKIRDYGQAGKYTHEVYGLNSRLDELQAALLRDRLKTLDNENKKRRILARKYIQSLKNIKQLEIIGTKSISDNNYHLFVIKTKDRDQLKEFLSSKGIETLIHYPSTIPDQPLFGRIYKNLKIPNARQLVNEVLSLPCSPLMTLEEANYVCDNVKAFFTNRNENSN